jgi:hypothetical protein
MTEVTYERLETTGSFCNVKFGLTVPFVINVDKTLEENAKEAFAKVVAIVDQQITDAKERKRLEIEREFRARQIFGDPDA